MHSKKRRMMFRLLSLSLFGGLVIFASAVLRDTGLKDTVSRDATPRVARAAPSIETPGPAFVDWKRGIEKQNNAAKDAKKEITAASFSPEVVFPLFADDSGYVRDTVFAALEKSTSDTELLALAQGLLHSEPLVAENIAELFGNRKLPGSGPLLAKAVLRSQFTEAREWMLHSLMQIDPALAAETAATLWKKEKRDWRVRGESLVVLAECASDKGRAQIEEALREKKILPLRIAGLVALRIQEGGSVQAFDAAMAQLESPPKDKSGVWGPRLEVFALEVLSGFPAHEIPREKLVRAIDLLIPSIDEAKGRARVARLEALAEITGEKGLTSTVHWRSWWSAKRESWEPGVASDRAGGGAKPPGDAKGDDKKPSTRVVNFHGIPVDSERVTFLQDLSGGMSRNFAGDSGGAGPTRLDHAKDELERVLGLLDDRTWVNVITFASSYFAPHKEPQLLKRARKPLVRFCREQEIPTAPGHARGNVYDALVYAATSPYVDTIYLVSEGAPTEGKYHDYDRFLKHFSRENRFYGARVHVLLVAETGGRNRNFLAELSKSTGGKMQAITTEQ